MLRTALVVKGIRASAPIWMIAAVSAFLFVASSAWAGNDIYFVAYNHHIEKGETELMIMTDLTRPAERTDGVGTYMSNMLELEYGVTDQFATELMGECFFDLTHRSGKFTLFRWENRYRLRKDKNWGLNPMLYMEYENLAPETRFKMEVSGREDGKGEPAELEGKQERIMETRLVLSRDRGPYNVAFNWINETDLRRGGFTDFGYALGIRRTLAAHHHEVNRQGEAALSHATAGWKPAAIGLELYGGLGNSRAFGGPFKAQQHYLQPVIMFHPQGSVMVHIAFAIGLTGVSDNLLRTGVGFEF